MMKRRSFLAGANALLLSQLISGCNSQQQASLNVRLLKSSIPAQMLNDFRKILKQKVTLNFDPEEQLKDLWEQLKTWKQQAGHKDEQPWMPLPFVGGRTPEIPQLVTLGDYWLQAAIEQQLIQPLEIQQLEGWKKLPLRWQEIVKRDRQGRLNKNGQVWGAPYRWGTTVIAYRQDKFEELGWTPKDWSDLWRPELRDRISLLDQPREVIGLTLKKLGHSYNTQNLSQMPNLKQELLKLHQQVKYYSSDTYLEPLILGDTWLALGWSTDVSSLRSSYRQIAAVVPLSGTALWTDIWVQPATLAAGSNSQKKSDRTLSSPGAALAASAEAASPTPSANPETHLSLAQQWIDFCWQPQAAREISVLSNAISPIITSMAANLPNDLQKNPSLLPDSSVLDKSEFIEPLPKDVFEQYQKLWKEIRSIKTRS